MLESMLKICIYTGINADVTLEDGRNVKIGLEFWKQNSQLLSLVDLQCCDVGAGNGERVIKIWLRQKLDLQIGRETNHSP